MSNKTIEELLILLILAFLFTFSWWIYGDSKPGNETQGFIGVTITSSDQIPDGEPIYLLSESRLGITIRPSTTTTTVKYPTTAIGVGGRVLECLWPQPVKQRPLSAPKKGENP